MRKALITITAYVVMLMTTMAWGNTPTNGWHEADAAEAAGFVTVAEDLSSALYDDNEG